MSIFTTPQYDASIWTPVETIYATHTEAVSLFRGIASGIVGLAGGSDKFLNKKMDDITGNLMANINKQIKSDQCVVGFSIEFTTFGRADANTTISGLAMGTLLKKKAQGGGRRVTLKRR